MERLHVGRGQPDQPLVAIEPRHDLRDPRILYSLLVAQERRREQPRNRQIAAVSLDREPDPARLGAHQRPKIREPIGQHLAP